MALNVFLSSNSRAGYSRHLIDLFAMPSGTTHQFRYERKLISKEVLVCIDSGINLSGQKALLCYLDQAEEGKTPILLPVRFAEIFKVSKHGSTISIVFKLGEICEVDDLDAFNLKIRASEPRLPDYKSDKVEGKYWFVDDAGTFGGIASGDDLEKWENLVRNYYKTPKPMADMPFYRFESITQVDSRKSGEVVKVSPIFKNDDLLFRLKAGKEYDVNIYHFHPKQDFPECSLAVDCDDENLVSLNGNTRVFNTRYDNKVYRIESKRIILGAKSLLAFRRKERVTEKLIWEDFVLRAEIKPALGWVLGYVGLVAVGFAVPFIVRTFTSPTNTSLVNDFPVWAAAFGGGVVVGLATLIKDRIRL